MLSLPGSLSRAEDRAQYKTSAEFVGRAMVLLLIQLRPGACVLVLRVIRWDSELGIGMRCRFIAIKPAGSLNYPVPVTIASALPYHDEFSIEDTIHLIVLEPSNAIRVQSATALDVRHTPRDGPAMGFSYSRHENPAVARASHSARRSEIHSRIIRLASQ
jgi:hypothetical protein